MPLRRTFRPSARFRLRNRPSWDRDGGTWYVNPVDPKTHCSTMYRWVPNLHATLEPLMGTSIKNKKGLIVGVKYPTMEERLRRYREAMEVLIVFRRHPDNHLQLSTIALYRRQVTARKGIALDRLFLEIARSFQPRLTRDDWDMLAQRMPNLSWVYKECLRRGWGTY